ncbi:MAG TPA: glycosyltransferase family 4 protein [Vicinamibacteria bacterium]|jgi:glycosyltransferase involved in cell wall biosynthesis
MFVINGVVADTRVVKEAASLAASGREVIVIGLRESDQAREEKVQGFSVRRVGRDPFRREVAGRTRAPGPVGRLIAPLRQVAGLLGYLALAFLCGVRLRARVYHAHDLITLPVAWAAARLRGASVVYDAHELFTEISRLGAVSRAVFRVAETLLIGRVDRVITVNDSIADELSRRYDVPRPTVVMNCPRIEGAATRDASRLRARVGLGAEVPIVLFQGMFMPHRGLENLVRAARSFARAHLVFMGWGPLRAPLEAQAAAEGVAGRVHFTDGVPLQDLLGFTAGADLGAIPYRNVGLNNYYTSPNKLFEYCAAGVPVVSSRFPELVKVVEGFGAGRTFDPESPEDIAAAVNGLLESPDAMARAREGAARAAQRYNWENESRKLLDVYASLGAA